MGWMIATLLAPLSEWFVARMLEARFLPATFEGTPFETEHWIHYSIRGRR